MRVNAFSDHAVKCSVKIAPDVAALWAIGVLAVDAPLDGQLLRQVARAAQTLVVFGLQRCVAFEDTSVEWVAIHAAGTVHAQSRLAALHRASDHLLLVRDRGLALLAIGGFALGPASCEEAVVVVALELDDTRLACDLLVGYLKFTVDAATAREDLTALWCSRHVHFTVVLRAALALHVIIVAASSTLHID